MTGATQTLLDDWPLDQRVCLTLDLECDYGTALSEKHYGSTDRVADLVSVLERHEVPLTCFTQTELFEERPAVVEALADAAVPVEFHAHSHTHPRRREADVEYEVETSVDLIRDHFETDPVGYRFPDGASEDSDFEVLAANSVEFDASLFPSWRPGRFNNLGASDRPYRHEHSGVVEFPFTVASSSVKIPVSLSYLKLLGKGFERAVYWSPPSVVVFGMHMHDLFVPESYGDLSSFYKGVYARNKHDGLAILDRFIRRFAELEYGFDTMSTLYEQTVDRAPL